LGGSVLDRDAIVVTGGGASLSSFVWEKPPYALAAKGGNIVVALPADFTAPRYVVTLTGDNFTAKRNGTNKEWAGHLSTVLDSVRVDAQALPCSVQIGDGAAFPDANISIQFSNTSVSTSWGKITLLGKLRGFDTGNQGGAIYVLKAADVTIENAADIMSKDGGTQTLSLGQNVNFTHAGGEITGRINTSGGPVSVTVSGGRVGSIYGTAGGTTIAVSGGKVGRVYNGGPASTVTVSGGTVGDSALAEPAINIAADDAETYITGGTVISADTAANSGTVKNIGMSGRLKISGGAVLNVAATGGTLSSAVYSRTTAGKVEVTGGKISKTQNNTNGGCAVTVALQESTGGFVSMLSVSGAAEIVSAGYAVRLDGLGVFENGKMVSGGEAEITGGRIENTNADGGNAVYNNRAKLTVSGTAEISANSSLIPDMLSSPAAIRGTVITAGNSELYILGGKITSKAESGFIPVAVCYSNYYPASGRPNDPNVFIGGSPDIEGYISGFATDTAMTVIASGFNPGKKVYTLLKATATAEKQVIVRNGAGFIPNFALDTVYSAANKGFALAASGNDIVATAGDIVKVSFSKNGATLGGDKPADIWVVSGAKLGELAKPPLSQYVKDGKANDGEWHIQNGILGGVENVGAEFTFSVGATGTKVNGATVLTLLWTDILVSVQAARREIPPAPTAEAAAIAPLSIPGGEMTAGPNPTAGHSGIVTFYWNGAALKGGSLSIYDATGNIVARTAITDTPPAKGKRAVAVWDLTDSKGRPVAGGVYAARGAVNTKSGRAEKVTITLGVRR
jgi:hypothetical protein